MFCLSFKPSRMIRIVSSGKDCVRAASDFSDDVLGLFGSFMGSSFRAIIVFGSIHWIRSKFVPLSLTRVIYKPNPVSAKS